MFTFLMCLLEHLKVTDTAWIWLTVVPPTLALLNSAVLGSCHAFASLIVMSWLGRSIANNTRVHARAHTHTHTLMHTLRIGLGTFSNLFLFLLVPDSVP